MNAIKTGCLEILLAWIAASLGLYAYFQPRFEPPGEIWGAAIGGLFVAMGWGSLRNAVASYSRRNLLKNAKFGMRPEDGKLCAAAGVIRALGEPLLTPFQKQPCVVYGYEVSTSKFVKTGSGSDSTTTHRKTTSMGGFAMCPCAVRTATGEVRILGFPFPTEFPERNYPASLMREKVLAYAAETKFDEKKGFGGVGSMWTAIKDLFSEDDGMHRYDWKTGVLEDVLEDEDTDVMEQFIPTDAEICVIGVYSQGKGGLVNDLGKGGLEVLAGKLEAGVRALSKRSISAAVFGVVFVGLGTAGAFGVLTARETRDSGIARKHKERLIEGLRANDLPKVEKALQRGASVNNPNSDLEPILAELKSKEMFDLLVRFGYDVNEVHSSGYTALQYAVERDNAQLVTWLLEAQADPNVPQANWGTTPIERAFDERNQEIFRALFNRGGRGIFVTEQSGSAIQIDGEEMNTIRKFYEAHRSEDISTLRALVDGWPEDFFESFARGLYRGTRDCEPEFRRGLANAEAATVLIACATGLPKEIWVVTLVRRGDVWKVRRESWDEKGLWEVADPGA